MSMFPNLPQLHQQVIARMKERELKASPGAMLKANVGAVIYITRAEMIERGRPTNQGIQELNEDIRRTLVYADPKETRDSAKEIRTEAESEWAKLSGTADQLKSIADRLDTEAKINEDRSVGKDPVQIKNEISFSVDFFTFKNRWDDYYVDVIKNTEATLEGQGSSDASDTIDLYDRGYRDFLESYHKLGYMPSREPPKKSNAGDTVGPIIDKLGNIAVEIPWGKIALFAGGLAAVYWVINRRPSPTPMPEAPRRIGPPEATSEAGVLARAHEGQ